MLQIMADEGVIAPLNQYIQVYLNGQFYGLYGMIEKVRSDALSSWMLLLQLLLLLHWTAEKPLVTAS